MADEQPTALVALTADITAAYVAANKISTTDLPTLVKSIHDALATAANGSEPKPAEVAKTPAVPVRKSITADHLICLEDGRKFKSLKRHLRTKWNLSPEEYRAKWGLPKDYPMVAPNYSAARSNLAKSMGLGQGGRKPVAAAKTTTAAKRARGPRAKKAT